jgi:hypothetical protein
MEQEVNITIYNSKEEALQSACADMVDVINNHFDFQIAKELQVAEEINELLDNKQYQSALTKFNHYVKYHWMINHHRSFHVYEKDIHKAFRIKKIRFPYTVDTSYELEEGATCRGPCGQYYEYAHPDQSNKTFVCQSCKLMSAFFNGISTIK